MHKLTEALETGFKEAKNVTIHLLGKPFGVEFIPKDWVKSIEGGVHAYLDENEMILFPGDPDFNAPIRPVSLIDKRGREKRLFEYVPNEIKEQEVVVHLKK